MTSRGKPARVIILGDASDAARAFQEVRQEADDTESRLARTGEKLGQLGAAAGLAMGAALTAAVTGAINREAAVDKAAARLALSESEAEQLGRVAGDAYASNFGESVEENLNVAADIIRRFGDLGEEALSEVTEGALTLADVFRVDVNGVINAAQQLLINDLAPNAQAALDLVGAALRDTKGDQDEVLEALNEYSTNFAQLGLDGPQVIGALTSEWSTNQFAIDKVGDAIKEMFIRLGDRSATQALDDIGFQIDDVNEAFAEGGPRAQEMIERIVSALANVEDPLEQTRIGAEIMGAPFEDLGGNALPILEDMVEGIGEVGDVTQEVADQAYDNVQGTLGSAWRSAKEDVIDAAEGMLPSVERLVEAFGSTVDAGEPAANFLVDKFAKGLQGSTIIFDAIADAFGISEGRAGDLTRALLLVEGQMRDGTPASVAYENALINLSETGQLTDEQIQAVARATGISAEEMRSSNRFLLEHGQYLSDIQSEHSGLVELYRDLQSGVPGAADRLRDFGLAVEEGQDPIFVVQERLRLLSENMRVVDGDADNLTEAFGDTIPQVEGAATALHTYAREGGNAQEATEGLAGAQDTLGGNVGITTEAWRTQFELLRAQTDPLFNLAEANERVAEAEAAVAEAIEEFGRGSDEHVDAVSDLAEANYDLEDAEISVEEAGRLTREEFIRQQIELDLTREQAELLADEFERLDAFEFDPKVIDITTRKSAGAEIPATTPGGVPILDAGGTVPGPRGAPRFVLAHGGETVLATHRKDPAAAIAEQFGPLMQRAAQPIRHVTQHITIPIIGTGDANIDGQRVGALESVLSRMETNP